MGLISEHTFLERAVRLARTCRDDRELYRRLRAELRLLCADKPGAGGTSSPPVAASIPPLPAPGFPSRLREIRLRRRLSQWEMARLAGVTDRTLRRWERGEVMPGPAQRVLLWAALTPEERRALWEGKPLAEGGD